MASISITTTQNVTIDYTLSGFSPRLFAFIIDWLIIIAWVLIHSFIGYSVFNDSDTSAIYIWVFVIPFFSFYTLLMEYFLNGQTPGKRSMGIRVIMINGKEPTFLDYFIRWSLRFVEIYLSSGVLASVMISTTDKKQRIADIIAGTVLVKVQIIQSILADDLIKIGGNGNYEPLYPEVILFKEEEMLVLKKLVDRFYLYRNSAHINLVQETAMQIAGKMGVKIKEEKPEQFLKAIIRDFVVLTR
jgi:uncharacterized RDD family membrane protein YckC